MTYLRGIWTLENGELSGSYFGETAESYTGRLDWEDYAFETVVVPQLGNTIGSIFACREAFALMR